MLAYGIYIYLCNGMEIPYYACFPKTKAFLGRCNVVKGRLEGESGKEADPSVDPFGLRLVGGQFHVHHEVGGVARGRKGTCVVGHMDKGYFKRAQNSWEKGERRSSR